MSNGLATTLTATSSDALSGVIGGEWWIGADPGAGHATRLNVSATSLSGQVPARTVPGSYTVSVRSIDAAGNWSGVGTAVLRVPAKPTGPVTPPTTSRRRTHRHLHRAPGKRPTDSCRSRRHVCSTPEPAAPPSTELNAGTGPIPANTHLEVQIAGRGGIPTNATAAIINATITGPEGNGYATIYPCTTNPPNASNLNYTTGQNIPNAAITKLSPTGTICIHTDTTTHLLIDTNGYLPAGSPVTPLAPARLLDTRTGGATIDGAQRRHRTHPRQHPPRSPDRRTRRHPHQRHRRHHQRHHHRPRRQRLRHHLPLHHHPTQRQQPQLHHRPEHPQRRHHQTLPHRHHLHLHLHHHPPPHRHQRLPPRRLTRHPAPAGTSARHPNRRRHHRRSQRRHRTHPRQHPPRSPDRRTRRHPHQRHRRHHQRHHHRPRRQRLRHHLPLHHQPTQRQQPQLHHRPEHPQRRHHQTLPHRHHLHPHRHHHPPPHRHQRLRDAEGRVTADLPDVRFPAGSFAPSRVELRERRSIRASSRSRRPRPSETRAPS